ncbi:hypothetical protein LCGC14_2804070, partial [marine sediment metagenome]
MARSSVLASLQADLDRAQRQEFDLARKITALKGEHDRLTEKEQDLEANLERAYEAIKTEQDKPESPLRLSLPADLPLMESALS